MDDGTLTYRKFDPYHVRWRVDAILSLTMAQIVVKNIARAMPEREALALASAVSSVTADCDEIICGNGRFGHGPPPHVFEAIAQLGDFAATLTAGSSLRADVADAAATLAERAGAAIRCASDVRDVDAEIAAIKS
jgi:hypothetical protein